MKRSKKDSAIAAALTFLIALVILLSLLCGGITFDYANLASSSITELEEEDQFFIEPELLELGEEQSLANDAPAESYKGEPEKAEEIQTEKIVSGVNPKPAPPAEKLVTSKTKSEVKSVEPQATDKEEKQVKSKIAGKFSTSNGNPDGKAEGSGSGGSGIGVSGNARGRTFISCPKPNVFLRHKTVVTVRVVIDDAGNVISAYASGSADASIRRKCEQAARRAKWSEKKGAAETHGSLTFTITPR